MSTQIANFASCLGKYDGSVLSGTVATLDPSSVAIGNFDLSLNSGYLSNPNAFTTPAAGNGTGFSVTGWFNPGGAQLSNFTPIFDMSGTSGTSTTATPFTINPIITGWGLSATYPDVSGVVNVSGTNYQVFAFRNGPAPNASPTTTNSYTLTYTCNATSSINVLLVGGGGTGGGTSSCTGGGGAGGVIMKSILIPANVNAQTMTIQVGAGGLGGLFSSTSQANGSNFSVTFNATGSASITSPTLTNSALTAFGGGAGASGDGSKVAVTGGSGGGGSRASQPTYAGGATALGNSTGTTSNYNYGNSGGSGVGSTLYGSICGGGGGAGGPGTNAQDNGYLNTVLNGYNGAGGIGIQCTLSGISQFTPSGFSSYGTYYWAGGGAGGNYMSTAVTGSGGLGGGGGSSGQSESGYNSANGGYAITVPTNFKDGAPNSGAGGGGTWGGTSIIGSGGSGIAVIAFPVSPVTIGSVSPATATLCVSGNSLTPALVATFNAQKSVYVPSGVIANAWNFFGYTVCCSGNTQLIQNLMVNNTMTTVTDGSYAPLTVANTYVGYGVAPYNNYFQGKIDDFRYYGRVLCPMEMRVLYSYAYGKAVGPSSASAVAPTLGTVTVGTLTATTAPLIFPSTGTYSYVGVTRTFAGVTTSFNVSPSLMVSNGSNYTWADTVAFTSSPSAYYVLTPYILGSPGVPQILTATIPLPSAITSVVASSPTSSGFTLAWTGGLGVNVPNPYTISNFTFSPVAPSATATGYSLNGLNSTITIGGLSGSTAYTVTVTANNGVSPNAIGSYSGSGSTTITATAPTTFTALSIATVSTTSFTASWSGATSATSYTYYLNGIATTPSTDNGVASKSATFAGLTASNRYSVYIKATNVIGSTWSITRPIDIANCTLWMDGSDPTTVTVTNGNQFTQWVDKTSNAYQFTCTATSALTYTNVSGTNPIKQFTMGGTQGLLRCTTCSIAPTFTIIVSGNSANSDYCRVVSAATGADILFGSYGPSLALGVGAWAVLNNFTPTASSSIVNPSVFCANHDATSRIENGYVNGTKLDATVAYTATYTQPTVTDINILSGGAVKLMGNTSEIIVYSGILSDTNRIYLEGYLAWKYGTQAWIVSGHLYKSSPPTGMAVWNP